MVDLKTERLRMVERDLEKRSIADPRVLDVFRTVERERFLSEELAPYAYDDAPLPIEEGQTISQPYIVALMAETMRLRDTDRVLEIGTGSGYAAAIFSKLAREVYTVERLEILADTARERLARLGYENVHVSCHDGSLGWPEHAPFDAIAVAAGGPTVPDALRAQLAVGGRLILPVGPDEHSQVLVRVTRESDSEYREEALGDVRFVPLIGQQGWAHEDDSFSSSLKKRARRITSKPSRAD